MQHQQSDNSKALKSLAVVVPRFGPNLGGGAEALVEALLRKSLAAMGSAGQLVEYAEVWTTCAQDHRTWENHYPPGKTVEDGLIVRRFPVSQRNLETFISAELAIQEGRPLTLDQQLGWVANSVNSHGLYRHIAEHGKNFSTIIFAPYLFATSFWGAMIYPQRSVLIPCLHDEAYAYLDLFFEVFRRVKGLIFNANAEKELAQRLYQLPDLEERSAVVGMGFEYKKAIVSSAQKSEQIKPYLLYSGRKETGKNLDLLIQYFVSFKEKFPELELDLRIIGSGSIEFCNELPSGVIDHGFVSEERKTELMGSALALCQPSLNESFSIVIMEAWLHGTPVIVHENCAVTREHVVRSGGGLYFSTAEDFCAVVFSLLSNHALQAKLGMGGKEYVEKEYSWAAVLDRLRAAFLKFGLLDNE